MSYVMHIIVLLEIQYVLLPLPYTSIIGMLSYLFQFVQINMYINNAHTIISFPISKALYILVFILFSPI